MFCCLQKQGKVYATDRGQKKKASKAFQNIRFSFSSFEV